MTSLPGLALVGLSTHVGSQFTTTNAYLEAARTLFELTRDVRRAHAAALRFVDSGGGFGVDYGDGCAATPADFVREARALQARHADIGDLDAAPSSRVARSSRRTGCCSRRSCSTR